MTWTAPQATRYRATLASLLVSLSVSSAAPAARAQAVRYELDSATPLESDAWSFISSGGVATYDPTGLTLQTSQGYAEWMLRVDSGETPPTTGWLADVLPGRGFWVEARLELSDATGCSLSGPGLWIDDGKVFIRVLFEPDVVHFVSGVTRDIPFDTTAGFHTYRVNLLGARHAQLLIDGNLVFDEPSLQVMENGKSLMFGDLGGCTSAAATWDYLAYDAFGAEAESGDEDDDGIDNADDNCVLASNADQKDADHDGVGDLCDLCVDDPDNDQDNDGSCADDDPCPTDARNDQNANGQCDTEECAPFATAIPSPVLNCPPICFCLHVGVDPIGGYGGGLENFAGRSPYGGGGTGTGGTSSGSGGALGGTTASGGTGGLEHFPAGGQSMGACSGMGCNGDGGTGSGGGGAHAGGGIASGPNAGAASADPGDGDEAGEPGGCGCRAARDEPRGVVVLGAWALGVFFLGRRRRAARRFDA